MAGQSWSINIEPSGDGVSLNPDVYGALPGTPLQAEVGDLVSWNNQTDDDHQISVSGETLDAKAWKSTTAYQVQVPTGTVFPYPLKYTCSTKQGDQNGLINVTA
jgi:hypothetical protein